MMHSQTQRNVTNVTTLFISGGGFCRWALHFTYEINLHDGQDDRCR